MPQALADPVTSAGVVDAPTAAAEPSIARVIRGGFCIGCGACTALDPSFVVEDAPGGFLQVRRVPDDPALLARASRVCPFGDAPDEDAVARRRFADAPAHHDGIGSYHALFAGWSNRLRAVAGSGGLTRWLMARLLDDGAVDFVVQVDRKQAGSGGELFHYALHRTAAEVLEHSSTSAYYPVTLDKLFDEIRRTPGRGAVTALPCFARAIRALAEAEPAFADKIAFVSGTICGSLKSRRYAQYLAHQMGVPANELDTIDFRGKSLSRVANEKCVEVTAKSAAASQPPRTARVQQLRGTDYGTGYFKYKGCDYCDDVLAETADIAFGDAWIEPYRSSPQGTNVVVVRNRELLAILEAGLRDGELSLDRLTPEQVVATQASGLRHRREGLAVRLRLVRLGGGWVPRKRVAPAWGDPGFVTLHLLRIAIRRLTALAWLRPESRAFNMLLPAIEAVHRRVTRLRRRVAPNEGRTGHVVVAAASAKARG